jgi:SAM-dependent methyltransferase
VVEQGGAVGSDPLKDSVSMQYEQWSYPTPIDDLPLWLQSNWQWFDPSHAHPILWPGGDYRPDMDVLIAGCGTNQAAVIAYTNPAARVVAIDVSESSLANHRRLADRYGLTNLELHRLPIEEVTSLGREFDLIITTGVLHHLADPAAGMRALAERLRPDAVLAVMVYAKYGRIGVEMMQSVFADVGLVEDAPSIRLVVDALEHLDVEHPVMSYLEIAPDLDGDAALIDTFLPGRARTYTIDECRDLAAGAGLEFQGPFFNAPYYAPQRSASKFLALVAGLPREQQWSVMERFHWRNACHFFMACRRDRPKASYSIDFSSPEASTYVPSFRYRCSPNGRQVERPGWSMELDPTDVALLQQVDGIRSIGQMDPGALELVQWLWQLDILAVGVGHERAIGEASPL